MDAEDKDKISGEFWDVINNRLSRDKAALIAEVWYLDTEVEWADQQDPGRMRCPVTAKICRWTNSIYWWTPDHEVFNEPNTVLPLLHYNRFWGNQAGDKLNARRRTAMPRMLAGLSARPSTGEGVLATCYGGRVIIQTFSDHDYRPGRHHPALAELHPLHAEEPFRRHAVRDDRGTVSATMGRNTLI